MLESQVIERFIECGDPHYGFARVYCDACDNDTLLAYSCKTRYFCPSCQQKRVPLYGECVEANVLASVAHRQYVFTVPKLLRSAFERQRAELGELCRIATRLLSEAYAEAAPGRPPGADPVRTDLRGPRQLQPVRARALGRPAQPHVGLAPGGRTGPLPRLGGFSAHNQVRIAAEDAEGRKKLSGDMLRAPMSLAKITYDAATGSVIYRSKMHLGLKRNFQVMPGAQWLELLCRHIPDRYEHLARYVGWYSNRARGERAKAQKGQDVPALCASPNESVSEPTGEFTALAKSAWARLIRKVYEADPLECPKCKGPMRIIALINDPPVVRRILEHLGLWQLQATERSPPVASEAWPVNSDLPMKYHPVPDIA